MSLGTIYLCCDDLQFYATEVVVGDNWMVLLEEFADDLLCICAGQRKKGQPRTESRAIETPESIIRRTGLPIAKTRFAGHRRYGQKLKEYSCYAITWLPGKPFPRDLLPDSHHPRARENCGEGTYVCLTRAHRRAMA